MFLLSSGGHTLQLELPSYFVFTRPPCCHYLIWSPLTVYGVGIVISFYYQENWNAEIESNAQANILHMSCAIESALALDDPVNERRPQCLVLHSPSQLLL